MAQRKNVVIGLLGTQLDSGVTEARWKRWRPTVAICSNHASLRIDRLELLAQPRMDALVSLVTADIAQVAPHTEVVTHALPLTNPWDFEEVYGVLDAFADSYKWRANEDYYLHITTGTHVAQICMFLLCETRAMPGRLLQSSPALGGKAGSRENPAGRIDIIDLELAKFDRLAARFRARRERGASLLKAGIETRNARFNTMIEELERVASRSRDPLLLVGETGTGKTALARRLYELKRERQHLAGELVSVNCATLRGDLAMSALFGHGKGAFTGATEARGGLLRKADKGLIFLDEIGELGRDEQAMLLTAIEERRFYPVGSDKEVTSDFQLVAGTNRDLTGDVRAGRFREDLLARLTLWTFHIPALRDRPEDLAPNLDYELDRVSASLGIRVSFAKPARDAFLRFAEAAPWRANFRDFGAAIRRMATLADGGRIALADVELEIARLSAATQPTTSDDLASLLGPAARTLDRFDRVQLADVVAVCRTASSLSAAGRILFAHSLATRTTKNDADRLRKYLARFELDFERLRYAELRPTD
ncbi:MAG: RNA repair transcriptional activator RtcR [Kofleriaceae bacterium]|nr:RNA repair transcriptional activator RtcR [Kofleriaceae bacterium]